MKVMSPENHLNYGKSQGDTAVKKTIAIVGAGATGIAAFIALTKKMRDVDINLIDPIEPGTGKAFNQEHDELLCNTSPDTMSLHPDNSNDFIDYIQTRGIPYTQGYFPPRYIYRDYVIERYNECLLEARKKNIDVNYWRGVVERIKSLGEHHYEIIISSGDIVKVSGVIIATGGGDELVPEILKPYQKHPDFYSTPYDVINDDSIRKGSNVLVIGTKLSAIDAAVLIGRKQCKITMLSPSGILPSVRTATPLPSERLVSVSDFCRLELESPNLPQQLCELIASKFALQGLLPLKEQISHQRLIAPRLMEEIILAEENKNHWQNMIVELVDATNDVLTPKSGQLKKHVISICKEILDRYLGSFSLTNARKIFLLLQTGLLNVCKGEIEKINYDNGWNIQLKTGENMLFDNIVCAAGYRGPNLRLSGCDITLDDTPRPNCESLNIGDELSIFLPNNDKEENIWVVGAACAGKVPLVNAMYSSVKHAYFVAEKIAGKIPL